ncbi:MAG: ParB/RepB/Spo0J family partition protein, partial [Minisyncoccia bacterium]
MATAHKQAHVLGESEESRVCRIPRSQIRRFPDQPRSFFDAKDMGDLAASIKEIGQQTPIVVKVITGDSKHGFELVDGERRWIACGMASVDTMLAWVRPIADSDEQFVASVVGNFGRSGHTALEISQAVDRIRKSKRLQDLSPGEQVARIAKIFARSEPWVYSHLAILRLHPEVQAMMAPTIPEEERLSHTLGVFISSLHQDLQLEIAKAALAKKMSLNRARLYARQVAEEAGVEVGSNRGNTPGLPSHSWRRLQSTVKVAREGLDALLVPAVQDALKKRGSTDRAVMVAELEQCVSRLNQLKASLMETPPALPVSSPLPPPVPVPEPVADDSSPSPKPADPSPPPLPKPVPQPTAPSSGNGQGTTPDGSTQSWDLSM